MKQIPILKKEERKIAVDKMSKRSVLWNSFLIFLLAATLVTLFVTSIAMSPQIHDVAVTDIRLMYNTTVVFPTWNGPLEINVTAKNNGDYKETFNVTAYYNETQWNPIETQTVTKLVEGAEENVTFTWDFPDLLGYDDNQTLTDPDLAWPYPVYEIKANATLANDANPDDNELPDGTVTVQWPGDCNGDGHVNQTDLEIVEASYGAQYPSPTYNSTADFNGTGKVDFWDLITVCQWMHKGPLDAHDVAVTNITFSYDTAVVYPTWEAPLEVNVTIKNKGWVYNETFSVTVYNDTTPIDTQNVTELSPGAETNVNFTWDCRNLRGYPDDPDLAWPYPVYEIKANASVVPGETNTTDNELVDGTVTVQWPGDCNGDGHVNQTDSDIVLNAQGGTYDPRADFNGNGAIDAGDLGILGWWWHKGPLDAHDVAVTNITFSYDTTVVYPTWEKKPLEVNVTIKNKGWVYNETNLNVTTHFYNKTEEKWNLINETNIDNLANGTEKTISFEWNCSYYLPGYPDNRSEARQYPVHTIRANVSRVEKEMNTEDNIRNASVTVQWPGDCNGDGHVNQTDVEIFLDAWSRQYPDPEYNCTADFNGDGWVKLEDEIILLNNMHKGPLDYCDINVTSISLSLDTTVVYTNCSLQIYVTVKNNGNNTETVQVTAYYNTTAVNFTVIDTKQVNITAGDEEPLTFTWKIPNATWPYLNYTLKANATLVCDENPDNNERIDGTVTVRWPGDCNGDGYVNATDLRGPYREDLEDYNARSDFDGDGDIDNEDTIILINHWETGPPEQ